MEKKKITAHLHCSIIHSSLPSDLNEGVWVVKWFANLPPDRLILLLAHWLRPLTKWWAVAKGVDKAVAMAAQTVTLSRNVGRILDDQLVVRSQPHVFCPLQEALHTALLFLLQWQPAMNALSGQPATHHWDVRKRVGKRGTATTEGSEKDRPTNPKRIIWAVGLFFWKLPFWHVMIFLWSW